MKFTNTITSILTAFLICSLYSAIAQQKEIELSKFYSRTVPQGKVWYISNTKSYKVIFSDGVFESGTSCNATVQSTPSYIYGISYYDSLSNRHLRPKSIGFTFRETPERLDNDVYLIKPYYILDNNMQGDAITKSLNWTYRKNEIVFYPGMVILTSSCLNNFMIYERDMSPVDQSNYQKWKNGANK